MNQVGGPLICTVGASAATERKLYRGRKNGDYLRLAPGHLIAVQDHLALSPAQLVKIRIVAHACAAPQSFAVGVSAAVLWGLPDDKSHPQRLSAPVELGRPEGRTCLRDNVSYRALRKGYGERTVTLNTGVGIVRVTDRLTTCLDLARWSSVDHAVLALDHCLQKERFTLADVDQQVREMSGVKGISRLRQAAGLASTGSESSRETTLKLLLRRLGLPAPLQQVNIYSRRGRWLGRVDFFYPELSLIIEYDGKAKYDTLDGEGRSTKEKEYDQTVARRGAGLADGVSGVRNRLILPAEALPKAFSVQASACS